MEELPGGVCQERWTVEECFAEAKGEVVGLDHYDEVRRWDAWHRHHLLTLCLLAHAFLALTPQAAIEEEASLKKGISRRA
ncbi:MAG: hypothetical protein M3Q29_15510 [Chloroflexota bacterium]|nr:hypothetical protein [Chloroflexota bacterium]